MAPPAGHVVELQNSAVPAVVGGDSSVCAGDGPFAGTLAGDRRGVDLSGWDGGVGDLVEVGYGLGADGGLEGDPVAV